MRLGRYLASDDSDGEMNGGGSGSDDSGVEEWAFAGPAPPTKRERKAGLGELLRVASGAADDDSGGGAEMSFTVDAEDTTNGVARAKPKRHGDGPEGGAPRSVFEAEEEKRKAKRRALKKKQKASVDDDADEAGERDGVGDDDDFFAGGRPDEEEGGGIYSDDGDLPDDLKDDPYFAEALREREEEDQAARRAAKKSKPSQAATGEAAAAAASGGAKAGTRAKGSKRRRKAGKEGADAMTPAEAAKAQKEAAALEMMLMDDDGPGATQARRGYNLKDLELKGGAAARDGVGKGNKRKRAAKEAAAAAQQREEGDSFALDQQDSRFASVYSSADFAIDPTDPKFRRTAGSEAILAQVQRKHADREAKSAARRDGAAPAESVPESHTSSAGGNGGGNDLLRLVASVKASGAHKKKVKAAGTGKRLA